MRTRPRLRLILWIPALGLLLLARHVMVKQDVPTLPRVLFWIAALIVGVVGLILWMLFRAPPGKRPPDPSELSAKKRWSGE